MRSEAKVGLFVLLGVVALLGLSTRISSVANIGKSGYRLNAAIENAAGLEINSAVKAHGVEIGYLENMRVENGKVTLRLFVFNEHKIADDSVMIVAQESILGASVINLISGGGSPFFFKDNDTIKRYHKQASISEAVDEIYKFMESLNETFDDETKEGLKSAIRNLNSMGEKLSAAGEEFRIAGETINKRLPQIVAQIDDLTAEFNRTGADINARLPQILDKFSKIEDDISELIAENKKPLNETIVSVKSFFEKGSETLESLDSLFGRAEKAEMQIDMFYNRLFDDKLNEGGLAVAYLPNPTNYYMLQVKSAPVIEKRDMYGNPILPSIHNTDNQKYLVSAQLGKRYNNWLVRGGIIDSSAGIGADFLSKSDRLKFSLDAYDFDAVHDIRGESPHLRFTARYLPWKTIAIYGGYDNFLNRDAANFFAGAGVHFVDDDLKYLLLSGAGSVAGMAK